MPSTVAGDAVSSYLTISPLPTRAEARPAVCFLLHFLWGRPPWVLPSILSCGARTFLTPARIQQSRQRDRPSHSAESGDATVQVDS